MNRLTRLARAFACLALSLLSLVGCHKIFGDFTIDDSAFDAPQIVVTPTKGLFTTEWGGQATFTIVLKERPFADVTIALSSSNENEGKINLQSVTFTSVDWKAPQVVTVTGQNDQAPDGSTKYKIITAPAVSQDPVFNNKNASDVELTNVDDETGGITVVPRAGLVTSEMGGQDTFTVVLNSAPQSNVIVNLVSDTPTEGTVGPMSLMFTPVNWMAPQVVTVTGVNDSVKDPAHAYKINVTATSDDPKYARVPAVSVGVTNQDDDSAGVSVALVSGIDPVDPTKLRTSESGDTASFTVALTFPPAAGKDVTIPVSSNLESEGTVSPLQLTFTADNWNAPQTVTVMGGEDDGALDGDQPYAIVLGTPISDDPDYAAFNKTTEVPVINVDNDKPGFTVMLGSVVDPQEPSTLQTTEAGTTATFTIALNSKPAGTVTISLSSSNPSEGTVTPDTLTFTMLNWQSPQTVSVTGKDDAIQDGNQVFFVRTSVAEGSDPGYALLDLPDMKVVNLDNDSAGVLVVLTKNKDPNDPNRLVTDESGSTATFTVALASEPEDDVSIDLLSSNEKEGRVSPLSLTFTKLNYRAPQVVTITGQNDDSVDGNQPFAINLKAASSNDQNYNNRFASQVQVTNRDDDSAGVIVTPTTGLTTSESGKSDSFTIRLQSKPADNVTISVASSNAAEGNPNVSSVMFTPINWNANQTVTVTGVDDDVTADGNAPYRIILAPASSNDANYNGKDPSDVSVTNIDNDSANILVTPSTGLITKENGLSATFTIVLTSKPVSATAGMKPFVKIQLSSSRESEGRVNPTSVSFDDVNWKSAQTVTVTGVDDQMADGPQPYLILVGVAQSNDPNYNNRKPSDVSVTNTDDDSAGVQILPLPTATPAVTTEKMGRATFTVALNSLPTSNVTISVASLITTEGRVSPPSLIFTSVNGKTPQIVTVTGVDDDVADGDQQYIVRLGNCMTVDPAYGGKFGTDLPFVNIDDDHPGVDVQAAQNLRTTEGGGTATFTVALMSQPSANVSIALSSSDINEGKVSPPSLQFTAGNWSTAQTVTITGMPDYVADGPQAYQVRLANAMSADANYSGKFGTQLDVLNVDIDQAGYTVNADPMLQTTEAGGKATFSVQLKSKPAGASTVTLGAGSNNTKEGTVSPGSLVFTASDWDQPHTVTVTGVDDKKADGNVGYQVTFTADMAYGAPAPAPVSITNVDDDVIGVLFTPVTPMCTTSPGTTATFTIRLNSQPTSNVTISLTSDTPAEGTVFPDSVTFTSDASSWEMPQTVTVTGVDDMTVGMTTPYNIITGDASAPGETTGYNGYIVADVACTNVTP